MSVVVASNSSALPVSFLSECGWAPTFPTDGRWITTYLSNRWHQGRESPDRSYPQEPGAGNPIRDLPDIPVQLSVKYVTVCRGWEQSRGLCTNPTPPDIASTATGNTNYSPEVREES